GHPRLGARDCRVHALLSRRLHVPPIDGGPGFAESRDMARTSEDLTTTPESWYVSESREPGTTTPGEARQTSSASGRGPDPDPFAAPATPRRRRSARACAAR